MSTRVRWTGTASSQYSYISARASDLGLVLSGRTQIRRGAGHTIISPDRA